MSLHSKQKLSKKRKSNYILVHFKIFEHYDQIKEES